MHLAHPKYRPDIDGLRAIAVLSVVGYHYSPERITGGFVGVDIFFVISGYLISTIIFGNLANERFSYAEFYARRIKRIFPALALVLFTSAVFGWYVLFPDEFVQLGKHIAGGAGFAANFVLWSEAGYFDSAAESKPLLHLWSLGIEEQFYIFWPLLLGIVWRKNINFLTVTFVLAALSFAISIYWIDGDPAALFFSPFSRIWELMIGGLLAYVMLQRNKYAPGNARMLSLLSPAGLLLIGISVTFFSKFLPYPGWLAAFPTIGAALVIAAPPQDRVNRYLLSHPVLVWIGLISYPLYLWHWPLLAYARIIKGGMPDGTTRAILLAASFLLASGTYILLEKRFKRSYSNTAILVLSLTMLGLLAFGLGAWKGIPVARLNSKLIANMVEAVNDWDYPGSLKPVPGSEGFTHVAEGAATRTLFIGDSHMEQIGPRIGRLLRDNPERNSAIFVTHGGCTPIPNVFEHRSTRCNEFMQEALHQVQRDDVKKVVIGAKWNFYFLTATSDSPEQELNDRRYYYLDDNGTEHAFKNGKGASLAIRQLESFISAIAREKQVYLLLDNPSGRQYSPKFFLQRSRLSRFPITGASGTELRVPDNPEQQRLRNELTAIAHRAGAEVIDPSARLCEEQRCMIIDDSGIPIYKDEDHLRPFYVEEYADFIDVVLD
jgi:peptidoglycan/LPS O-acetylase OafA/YrhL